MTDQLRERIARTLHANSNAWLIPFEDAPYRDGYRAEAQAVIDALGLEIETSAHGITQRVVGRWEES